MSNDMLGGALAEVAGPLKDLLGKLGGKDGEMWLQAFKRFLRRENPWKKVETQIVRHSIDCGLEESSIREEDQIASRFIGWLDWDPTGVALHLDDTLREGVRGGDVRGSHLEKKLKGQPVLPARVLEYLLSHPALIPSDWKGKDVFFFGTIYLAPDNHRFVRYLYWDEREGCWTWGAYWLGLGHMFQHPMLAAVVVQ